MLAIVSRLYLVLELYFIPFEYRRNSLLPTFFSFYFFKFFKISSFHQKYMPCIQSKVPTICCKWNRFDPAELTGPDYFVGKRMANKAIVYGSISLIHGFLWKENGWPQMMIKKRKSGVGELFLNLRCIIYWPFWGFVNYFICINKIIWCNKLGYHEPRLASNHVCQWCHTYKKTKRPKKSLKNQIFGSCSSS